MLLSSASSDIDVANDKKDQNADKPNDDQDTHGAEHLGRDVGVIS